MEKIIFYILAIIIIVFAVASVTSRKMLRSVVYLLFVLIAIAGIYFLIDYNFLAGIQLTIYAGGVIILMIFSVFLIHHIEMELEVAKTLKKILTTFACLVGLGIVLSAIYSYPFNAIAHANTTTIRTIGKGFLSYKAEGFILPFEVISVLLLAVMIGSIVIAKGKKLTHKNQ